eukprot:scaffold23153_cov280-Skeletonema_menzelii.AAC.3
MACRLLAARRKDPFDWGGRLLKSNGGARRLTNRTGTEVGYSDPVTLSGKGHRSTDKRDPIDGVVWHLDVGLSHPGAVKGSKGLAVRQERRYMI